MATSGWAQAQGPQTGWNQKANDWDSWNTTLLSHQPIRGGLHTLQPSPQVLPINTSFLKPLGSFELEPLVLLIYWPCNKPFSAPNSKRFGLFGLTVLGAQELGFNNHTLRLMTHRSFKIHFSKLGLEKILQQSTLFLVVSKSKGIDRAFVLPFFRAGVNKFWSSV